MAPAQEMRISVDFDGLIFDEDLLPWEKCQSWVMVELDDAIEFTIQTTNFDTSYYYFYIDHDQEELRNFIAILAQSIPYNEKIEDENFFHKVVRVLGLG